MRKAGLPALVQLAILTLFTAVLWIGFEVYRAFTVEPLPEVNQRVLQQINPTLDQIELDRLVNRINLSEDEIGDTVLTNPNQEVNIVEEVDLLEELNQIVDDNQATESGQN